MSRDHDWVEDRVLNPVTSQFGLYPAEQLWVCSRCGTGIAGIYGLQIAIDESPAPPDYFDCTAEKMIDFTHER